MRKLMAFVLLAPFGAVMLATSRPSASARSLDEPPITFPKIDRHPLPMAWWPSCRPGNVPIFDPTSSDPFQVDFRHCDLRDLDLRPYAKRLLYATFDTATDWPKRKLMPKSKRFSPDRILALGKNPGLGIRALHRRGIDGRGVGVAVIDQVLLVDHDQYAARLRLYEEIEVPLMNPNASMHGPAVSSILVGKNTGVAPAADLYFIAAEPGDWHEDGTFTYNWAYPAQAIRRLLAINRQLPPERKIRVISMSMEPMGDQLGFDELMGAVAEARAAGIFVVYLDPANHAGTATSFRFNGLDRPPLVNPDRFASWTPGMTLVINPERLDPSGQTLLVPMGSRALAGPGSEREYAFYRSGGWSWTMSWIAGLYALAAQVDPSITPDRFWQLALSTGRTIKSKLWGRTVRLGPIADPQALIAALQGHR